MAVTRSNKIRERWVLPGEGVVSDSTRIAGQRVVIAIFHDYSEDAPDTWRVALLVGATRQAKKTLRERVEWKDEQYSGKSTGRSGLAALLWAAKKLDEFQMRVPYSTIVVGHADDRRGSAYNRLLSRGFTGGYYRGEPVVYRTPEMFAAYKAATRRNARKRPTANGRTGGARQR